MLRREALTTTGRANFFQRWAALLGLLSLLHPASLAHCQGAAPAWKSGDELQWQLDSPVSVRWASNPLRAALTSLARTQGVAIFLDRRVDPDQTVDLVRAGLALRELLQELAGPRKLGVGHVGPVVYLGPLQTAAVLGTVVAQKEEHIQRAPPALRTRLQRPQPLRWPELATPRELIQDLAATAGLQVEGLEQIPHDVWPEVDLPPLTFAQSLSLVLAGFQLTFDYVPETAAVRLAPLPAEASVVRRIPVRGAPAAIGAEIRRRFPEAQFKIEADHVVVNSTVEVSDGIRRLVDGAAGRSKPPPAKTKVEGQKRFTLRVQDAPLAAVAKAVAKEVGVELRFDPRIEDMQDKLVWLDVKDMTLDQLLQTLLKPGGLTYRLDDTTLEIRPEAAP